MKKMPFVASTLLAVVFLLQGCLKDDCRQIYRLYKPIYKTLTQARASMKAETAQPLKNTGKLNLFGNIIFLNEVGKGIHIIDNSNPTSPRNAGFINIPGNIDLAVKGNYLYADSYSDIIVFDISSPLAATPVKFMNNVMREKDVYWGNGTANPDSIRVIVAYEEKDTLMDCNTYQKMAQCASCSIANTGGVFFVANPTQTGTGGSMASFTIVNDYLYTVSASSLYSINISQPQAPQQASRRILGWGIETIYPFQNKLFIGSRTGMFIFDLTNPSTPTQQGQFNHATRCDPVVADGQYAYVTLRGGTACNGFSNELNVIDVSNLSAPTLRKRLNLTNPYGLAKDGDVLMVCDGTAGLRIYNAADPLNLQLQKEIKNLETFDVIALNKRAIVVAKDGLYQYDYSNPANTKLLSKLSITKN